MNSLVRRTCADITNGDRKLDGKASTRPLEEFVATGAYVLLGAPGSGKTTEFVRQARESGGHYVTVRDFLTFEERSVWRESTLFLDALDESRAGLADGRTPLDAIRAKLALLGSPKFRLSCREADWFGSNDRQHLQAVSPNGTVRVLRLEPLSEQDAEEILEGDFGMQEPGAFIQTARERGVDGMLVNPQSLGLLARAVQQDDWPSTRTETFELACGKLAREYNSDHYIADPRIRHVKAQLRAASKLFALQLLTGAKGFERIPEEDNRDYLALEDIPIVNGEDLHLATRTKLFIAPDGKRSLPLHRQIAEFLAAGYLAELVAGGLPVRRVLALMTGLDGTIVSELRGLGAWLAVHSASSRTELIKRDALGVVLYGDVQGFARDDKHRILDRLERSANENPWFVRAMQIDSRIGDLVFPGFLGVFRERTMDSRRDDHHQSFVYLLVEILAHGKADDGVASELLRVVRDSTWWPRIRHGAIEALSVPGREEAANLSDLKALLHEVSAGRVADSDDSLLAWLLDSLYPDALREGEVLRYLRAPKRGRNSPAYGYFWQGKIGKKSNCEQLARLLDGLVDMREWLDGEFQEHGQRADALRRVPSNLLVQFLKTCEELPDAERLFGWLGVAGWVGDWNYDTRLGAHGREYIRNWIGERPEVWKVLMNLGLRHCIESAEGSSSNSFNELMWQERNRRLFGAKPPREFGSWCLMKAVATQDEVASSWLINQVAESVHRSGGTEISIDDVSACIDDNDVLKREFERRLKELKDHVQAEQKVHERPVQRLLERQREWKAMVRESQVELRENRASPALLHRLGQAYLGGYGDVVGDTPKERLKNLLGNDEEIVETVLTGIRGTVTREDLPSDEEIINLSARKRMHFLSYPFLAGLDEVQPEPLTWDDILDVDRARLALALHYTVAVWPRSWQDADQRPPWYTALLNEQPEIVEDVLIRTARSELRKGRDYSQHLFDLVHSEDHKHIACEAAVSILGFFPVRCTEQQLPSLRHLLMAACLHCKAAIVNDLIERKLKSRSMNVAQRVYWLSAGLIVSSTDFVARLKSYVADNARRVMRLSQFFASRSDTPRALIGQLDSTALSFLIRTIGASHIPYSRNTDSDMGVLVTPGMEAADRVFGMINILASNTSHDASDDLRRLATDDRLVPWRAQLIDAKSRQTAIRRDACFVYATLGQAVEVLKGGKPANVGDLAALVFDQLREIAHSLRDGNTSDWLLYWNEKSPGRPSRPRSENVCRNALLSALRHHLCPLGIVAEPEGQYADGKRADISVSYGGFNVPIEIKKSCRSDLWSGIRRQLITKYARDPRADGHGIYVVLWFGDTEHCRPTASVDGIPLSAADVEKRLMDSLSEEEKRKIAVCSIDVASSYDASFVMQQSDLSSVSPH